MSQPWRNEDFVADVKESVSSGDFWEPPASSPRLDDPEKVSLQAADFWDPSPSDSLYVATPAVAGWFDGIQLSTFRVGASENPFIFEERTSVGERLANRRARWLLSLLDVPVVKARLFYRDIFEELFDYYDHQATFRALTELALNDVAADDLVTAFHLKQIWAERPKFWSIRRKGMRAPITPLGGQNLLGWSRSVRFADLAKGLPPENIIDEDWFDEWLQLPFADPLYWSFIEYVTARLEAFSDGALELPRELCRVEERWLTQQNGLKDISIDGFKPGRSRTGFLVRMETDDWVRHASLDANAGLTPSRI